MSITKTTHIEKRNRKRGKREIKKTFVAIGEENDRITYERWEQERRQREEEQRQREYEIEEREKELRRLAYRKTGDGSFVYNYDATRVKRPGGEWVDYDEAKDYFTHL